jgi:hypothetical protein
MNIVLLPVPYLAIERSYGDGSEYGIMYVVTVLEHDTIQYQTNFYLRIPATCSLQVLIAH